MKNNTSWDERQESVLDIIFDHYIETRGHDSVREETAYKDFCHSLLDVDPFQIDEIMGCLAVLCMEHERSGFIAGFKANNQLKHELAE